MSNLASLYSSFSAADFFLNEGEHQADLDDVSQVDIQVLAVELSDNPDYIARIDPKSTKHYDYLVNLAVSVKPSVITQISSAHFTRKQLQFFLEQAPSVASMAEAYHPAHFKRFFDIDMANHLISRKVSIAAPPKNEHSFFIEDHLITDEALCAGIIKSPYFGYIAVQRGRHHVIKGLMEDGFWPEGTWIKKKAVRLKTAIKHYLSTESDPNLPYGPILWYRENILSFPVRDVVKEMCAAGHALKLDDLFPRDVTAPYTKENSNYKRACLTVDLGI